METLLSFLSQRDKFCRAFLLAAEPEWYSHNSFGLAFDVTSYQQNCRYPSMSHFNGWYHGMSQFNGPFQGTNHFNGLYHGIIYLNGPYFSMSHFHGRNTDFEYDWFRDDLIELC